MRALRRPAAVATGAAVLALCLAVSGCSDDGTGATPPDVDEAVLADMNVLIDEAYAVATEQWEDRSSFPRTDAQLERLNDAVAERVPEVVDGPGGAERWRVVTYRGDYGGNKGMLACSPDVLTLRMAVPPDGRSIGFGVADGDLSAVIVYDPDKIGENEQFNDDGFYSSSGPCATDDTELDATRKATRKGRF